MPATQTLRLPTDHLETALAQFGVIGFEADVVRAETVGPDDEEVVVVVRKEANGHETSGTGNEGEETSGTGSETDDGE